MASSCITFPARKGLSSDINDLATEWGYKQHGNGGYTGFISEIIEAVVENAQRDGKGFDLALLLPKKQKITANK